MPIGLILNVGATKTNDGLYSPIFPDGTFKFLPFISGEGNVSPITYRTLDLQDYVPEGMEDVEVHNDPEFETFTYGHVIRFNEKKVMKNIKPGDYLFFMVGMQYVGEAKRRKSWINPNWGMYIVGYFKLKEILTLEDIKRNADRVEHKYSKNAHIIRGDVPFGPDYLFKGRKESSKLLDIVVPLSSAEDPRRLADPLIGILHTVTGRPIREDDRNWYRWILKVEDRTLKELLNYIEKYQREG